MGFFHLPSSSNAANDVKQLVRRKAFPRAIVGCYCFAEIVQNTQGSQCLQPTAIYNSYQFFSAFRFQQPCLPIVNILNEPPYAGVSTTIVFCLALQQELRGYRNRSNATSATTRGLLMSRTCTGRNMAAPEMAHVHLPWRCMCLSLVAAKDLRNKANIGSLHSPLADTRCNY
jgi:hypothetical protein